MIDTSAITGSTRIFVIVADPVAHVRTPGIFNAYCARNGLDAVMVPMHSAPEDLAGVFDAFRRLRNVGGIVVTIPHKTAALSLCDELSDVARAVGAVNTIRRAADGRLRGANFDGLGFVSGLLAQGIILAGQSVLMLGSGGAAAAIAYELLHAKVSRLVISNRSESKATRLVERLVPYAGMADLSVGPPHPQGFQLIINATSLGLRETDALPLDPSLLEPGCTVAEVIMEPAQTRFLSAAEAKGCRIHPGRHMLEQQIACIARFLFDDKVTSVQLS